MAAAAWSWLLGAGFLALSLLLQLAHVGAGAGGGGSGSGLSGPAVFTSSFLVRFRRGVDNGFAHEVADKYGFDNLGPVSRYVKNQLLYCRRQEQVARLGRRK